MLSARPPDRRVEKLKILHQNDHETSLLLFSQIVLNLCSRSSCSNVLNPWIHLILFKLLVLHLMSLFSVQDPSSLIGYCATCISQKNLVPIDAFLLLLLKINRKGHLILDGAVGFEHLQISPDLSMLSGSSYSFHSNNALFYTCRLRSK